MVKSGKTAVVATRAVDKMVLVALCFRSYAMASILDNLPIICNSRVAVCAHYDRLAESGALKDGDFWCRLVNATINNDQAEIRMMRAALQIQQNKRIFVQGVRNYGWAILENNYMGFWERLQLTYSYIDNLQVIRIWEHHPISDLDISGIPGNFKHDWMRTDRLKRCDKLALGFVDNPDWIQVQAGIKGLQFKGSSLSLSGVNVTAGQVMAFKIQNRMECEIEVKLSRTEHLQGV